MNLRKELLGGLAALLLSAWIVMGSFALAISESGAVRTAVTTPTNIPTVQQTTAQPTVLLGKPSPTTVPTSTPTLTSTPVPPTGCPPPPDWQRYTTRRGDTLDNLAEKFSTTTVIIMQANCMSAPGLIPNTIIYLPVPIESETPTITPSATRTPIPCGPPYGWNTYTVRSGDTLFHLAWAYNVTVYELQVANCMVGFDHLVAGWLIYVPYAATRTVSPTPITPTATVPSPIPSVTPWPSMTPTMTETPTYTPTSTEAETPTITETLPIDIPSLTYTPTAETVVPYPGR